MYARQSEYGAGGAPAHLPGKQVRLRPAVRAGALYRRPASNHPSIMERKLDKLIKNQAEMQKDLAEMQKDLAGVQKDLAGVQKDLAGVQKDLAEVQKTQAEMQKTQVEMQKTQAEMQKTQAEMQKSIAQLTTDTAVNKALVAVNLTPAASLVLGVLYLVYNNFSVHFSGGG